MELRSALLKVRQILLRLWGIDPAAPPARRARRAGKFAHAKLQRVYTRDGVRVPVSPRTHRDCG